MVIILLFCGCYGSLAASKELEPAQAMRILSEKLRENNYLFQASAGDGAKIKFEPRKFTISRENGKQQIILQGIVLIQDQDKIKINIIYKCLNSNAMSDYCRLDDSEVEAAISGFDNQLVTLIRNIFIEMDSYQMVGSRLQTVVGAPQFAIENRVYEFAQGNSRSHFSSRSASGASWNILLSPLEVLVSSTFGTLSTTIPLWIDGKINNDFTMGPYLHYIQILAGKEYSLGFRLTYNFNHSAFRDGFYISAMPLYNWIDVPNFSFLGLNVKGYTADYFTLDIIAGYHWFWDSFNMWLGLGFTPDNGDSKTITNSSGATATTQNERAYDLFRMGWSF